MFTIEALEQIDFNSIQWDRLVHWNGRTDDLPVFIEQLQELNPATSRMALFNLANNVEHQGGVVLVTPAVLIKLFQVLKTGYHNQDLMLRVIMKIAKAVGFQWETFRDGNEFENVPDFFGTLQADSPFLWPEFVDADTDKLYWTTTDMGNMFDLSWYYTKEVLCAYQPVLEQVVANDEIEQGILYDLLTIVKMVKDQERKPFDLNKTWLTDRLELVVINDNHLDDLMANLTPAVAKYLSFDPTGSREFMQEYIRRSRIEVTYGTALVLAILDKQTKEFIGSCALNDINNESVEIGLWLKESAQNKRFGTEVVEAMVNLIKGEVITEEIIYCVERENEVSVSIPLKFGFTHTYDFVLEPTPLKNRMREMAQYVLSLK